MKEILKKYYALLVILLVYVIAIISVVTYRINEAPPGTITIRISHWQLESGVRDAFNKLAEEYQKLHPNVRIIQEAIPESVYGQWLSTQIIGGTAPDIVEMGMIPYQLMIAYYNRYCMVLTPYINKPNPYNKNNEFANVTFRNTYRDGMSAAYVNEMQEFMTIPLSAFSIRVFYNKDLLKKLTGSDKIPKNYQEFKSICKKIAEKKDNKGRPYTAIVGSKYHFGMWNYGMADILTYRLMEKADFTRDAYVSNDEFFSAIRSGVMTFKERPIMSMLQVTRFISDNCQPGFTGLNRDDGVLLFAQQRAVFMTTGTWDARSLQQQTKGKFELGIMDFPIPTPDDPEFGDLVPGPRYENPGVGFMFAVNRMSKSSETALDFLMFLASKENNERLNKIIGWIPAIKNTSMDAILEGFEPNYEGIYGNFNPYLGGETWIKWFQLNSLYQVNREFTAEQFVSEFEPFYKEKGYFDFLEQMKDRQRGIAINERFLTGLRGLALSESDKTLADSVWIKYRAQTRDRQLNQDVWIAEQFWRVEKGPEDKEYGPYVHRPEILKKAKENYLKTKNAF
ncbi:MAG TPA: ABC transporter substrate-binding protein [Victivallales bacterium]|nr:ABC transporter substrate-binding protein [Victivallales bacterium]HRU00207.1 ABC transporter substrate-binding protein [Victivallales bacterium]